MIPARVLYGQCEMPVKAAAYLFALVVVMLCMADDLHSFVLGSIAFERKFLYAVLDCVADV